MEELRVCVLYTGGKDSCYALHWTILHGFEIGCLVTLEPPSWESLLFHYPGTRLVRLHAKALGLKLVSGSVGGVGEETELKALKNVLRRAVDVCGCEGVVSGALLSDYQRLRFAVIAEELGLRSYTPLWRVDQAEYMRSLVREGFKVLVLSVSAYGVPEDIVGRVLDGNDVERIIQLARVYGFNPAFEGGEAETFVVDAPLFRYRIDVRGVRRKLTSYHVVYEIQDARLVPKD